MCQLPPKKRRIELALLLR